MYISREFQEPHPCTSTPIFSPAPGPARLTGQATPPRSPAEPPGTARRRSKLGVRALKPVTYSLMHLTVAITVAYVLTGDWRIALGVGIIEPMVQTVAYMLHEKAWSAGKRSV